MKPLRTYIIIKNFASSLSQPFISFVSAAFGISGESLAIVSSAGSALPSFIQFLLGFFNIRGKTLTFAGTLVSGILWISLSFIPFNSIFVIVYVFLEASLGVSAYGWYLIMERVSNTSRGKILAQYSFYSVIGGIIATLITGFAVNREFGEVKYFFLTSGLLFLFTSLLSLSFDVDYARKPLKGLSLNKELTKFLLITFLFDVVWSMAWPLFPLAQVYVFNMSFENVAIIDLVANFSTLLLQRKIGELVDKNRRLMMFLGRLALSVFPLSYALSTSVYEIYLANIVAGFTSSINSTAYLSYIYDNSKDVRKGLGLYNAVGGLGDIIGSSIGSLGVEELEFLGLVVAIKVMMLVVASLRVTASLFYLKIQEVKPIKF
ncbi:MFS transporter [Acidianus sp. HS-5]|uniref:MFS transporter n=1 Tax=Acidianus sp. HS-5 TaxID=2886040 RepID=UPI001F0242E4|nr:MFS transporter [Acidianus sp. HS-5]